MGFHTIEARGRQEEISVFFNFFSKIGYDDFLPVHQTSVIGITIKIKTPSLILEGVLKSA
jgi:hypothetical protein